MSTTRNGHEPTATVPPQGARTALDAYFLEARCRLLDLAAILDRIDRGEGAEGLAADPRLHKIREALEAILDPEAGRAENVQRIFSLEYDPKWEIPQPRY
jgi:hypothetical protein